MFIICLTLLSKLSCVTFFKEAPTFVPTKGCKFFKFSSNDLLMSMFLDTSSTLLAPTLVKGGSSADLINVGKAASRAAGSTNKFFVFVPINLPAFIAPGNKATGIRANSPAVMMSPAMAPSPYCLTKSLISFFNSMSLDTTSLISMPSGLLRVGFVLLTSITSPLLASTYLPGSRSSGKELFNSKPGTNCSLLLPALSVIVCILGPSLPM